MLSPDEAADLIEAIAIRQDRAAFASLFRHYAPRVKAFIMRGGTDAETAQEVAQEALIMVWRKAASAAWRAVERLDAMGGALMEGEAGAAVDDAALERTLARLDKVAVEPRPAPGVPRPGFEWAPAPLARHIGADTRWRRVLGGLEEIRLRLPGDSHRVSLLKLRPGRGLPMHRHVGNEYTVVLQGGYTDSTGNYGVGDFAVGPGAQQHEPIADPGPPCIALIVIEKPIVLTGPLGRWLNPLVRRDLI